MKPFDVKERAIYQESAEYIKNILGYIPEIALVLGSGLGEIANTIEDRAVIPYGDIPHFPVSTVFGHAGQLVCGTLGGRKVLCMQGRFHFYEGYSMDEVVYPIRTMNELGIKNLFLTNAAGGINPSFHAGDLMIIRDHIKLFADSPLRGKNIDEYGERFHDMTYAYDISLRQLAKKVGEEMGMSLRQGVYAMMGGPSFETPAEIRALSVMGADAVGMSTVPEVITAVHAGMRVLAISCISNMAAGILDQPLSHQEVMETAELVKGKFIQLVSEIVKRWS